MRYEERKAAGSGAGKLSVGESRAKDMRLASDRAIHHHLRQLGVATRPTVSNRIVPSSLVHC